MFSGKLAYISCGFGIVVINLERKEIKDSYFIGNEGNYLNVMDIATDGTFLYAATVNGIYKANASEPNLQNYNNWVRQTNIPHSDKKFNAIESFNGQVIANYTPDQWYSDEMYQLSGNNWVPYLPEIKYIAEISTNGNTIVFSSRNKVLAYNNKSEKIGEINKYVFSGYEESIVEPSSAIIDAQNILWIADQKSGLVKVGAPSERIVPEGPIDNKIFSLSINGQDLWIASGGMDASWNNLFFEPRFQLNRESKWSVFDRKFSRPPTTSGISFA